MRRFVPVIACLVAYVMTPMAAEVTESVLHLLTEGHTAHSVADDAHHPDEPEHGCSGLFHLCPCHSAVVSAAVSPQQLAIDVTVATGDAGFGAWTEDAPSDGHLESVFRPPIA